MEQLYRGQETKGEQLTGSTEQVASLQYTPMIRQTQGTTKCFPLIKERPCRSQKISLIGCSFLFLAEKRGSEICFHCRPPSLILNLKRGSDVILDKDDMSAKHSTEADKSDNSILVLELYSND